MPEVRDFTIFNASIIQFNSVIPGTEKESQGTGLNRNCKFLLLEFAFDVCGFDRLEFQADKNNARSIAAMKSIGCSEEGVLRSHLLKPDGSRRDSIVLSILRDEWQNRIKEELTTTLKKQNLNRT
ncbi:hypothetical protein MASR2M18_22000 [Ignavibacteria bacterium]